MNLARHRRRALPLAAVVLVASCAGSTSPATSTSTPDSIIDSGVGVVASGCAGRTNEIGSGITIGQRGQVVTTAHTVAGAQTLAVVNAAGDEFTATIVAFDKDADLALLDVPELDAPPLDLGIADIGDATAIVWNRELGVHALDVEVTRRLDITIEDIYIEDEVQRSGIELRGEISVGDSGGAIVETDGDVIGVIYARSRPRPGIAFATDHNEIARLLRELPADPIDRCT